LGEQLVRNGLARIHGYKAAPPGLRNSRVELQKLQLFEQQARQEKIGAWGVTAERLNIRAENQSGFSSFIPAEKPRSRATPAASPAIPFSTPKPGSSVPFGSTINPTRSHPKAKTPLGRIDINTATEKELTTVPGIGHVTAARIIAARPFRSADDLKRVSGVGDKKYAQIRPYFQ
jgi:competence protein ComEA